MAASPDLEFLFFISMHSGPRYPLVVLAVVVSGHYILSLTHDAYARATSLSRLVSRPATAIPQEYYPDPALASRPRANATFVILARNSDLDSTVRERIRSRRRVHPPHRGVLPPSESCLRPALEAPSSPLVRGAAQTRYARRMPTARGPLDSYLCRPSVARSRRCKDVRTESGTFPFSRTPRSHALERRRALGSVAVLRSRVSARPQYCYACALYVRTCNISVCRRRRRVRVRNP
ncbi:hypothetical protein B0H17DRAFT_1333842 [Mycena rosella]|uniref:Uncharacterized protein n=1 Tax=Mycena rosella TaxID=1033263 RepID=A0AAD7D767_MYCRO|nr:hypothetical protein B0H17DRAFT_1333842 [Mycena rosella]